MDGCSFACATVGDRTSRALVWLPGTRGLSNLAQHDLGLHRIQCCLCCTKMSRLGTVGADALRVALCTVEMTGAAAEQIDDVDAIVDKHYDAVAYSGYTRAMMRAELEEEQRKGKCVAFHAMKLVHCATLFTGQAKALGGYRAETAAGERATAIHMEHSICQAIATGAKATEMRFGVLGSTAIPHLRRSKSNYFASLFATHQVTDRLLTF